MSINSRNRNAKRPSPNYSRQPRPDMGYLPIKNFGLVMPRTRKTTGAFGKGAQF